MTALVALEHSNLTDTVTFTAEGLKEAVPGNSYVTPVIQEGETLTMEQCLYAIMLVSGNEVSTQVAMQVGGSVEGFVEMMNEKAQEIGCKDTHFVNANGLHDENHYTTAHDLAMIAQEAYKNEEFRKIVGSRYYTIPATIRLPRSVYLQTIMRCLERGTGIMTAVLEERPVIPTPL